MFHKYCAAVIGNHQTVVRRLSHAMNSDLDILIKQPFRDMLDTSIHTKIITATIFAANNIQIPSPRSISPCKTLESGLTEVLPGMQALVRTLRSSDMRHEPLVDALLEQMFKAAIETENVGLAKLLLARFHFNLADALPGEWKVESGALSESRARIPLEAAIASRNAKMVQLLLDHGADVNATGISGNDMLKLAARERNEEALHLLLPSFRRNLMPALLSCLECGLVSSAELIWDRIKKSSPRPIFDVTETFYAAAKYGSIAIASDLLRAGVDVNATGTRSLTPLQAVAFSYFNHPELAKMAELLINWGAEVDYCPKSEGSGGETALQLAVFTDNLEVATILVNAGADVDPQTGYRRPVDQAAISPDLNLLRLLLNSGANPSDKTLACAVQYHRHETIEFLLDFGVRPSTWTLISAAKTGNLGMLRRCIDAGVDVNSSANETTALIAAIERLCFGPVLEQQIFETSKLLLDHGARLDVGEPLTKAVRFERTSVFDLLLSRGAEFDTKDVLLQACKAHDPYFQRKILEFIWTQPALRTLYTTTHFGYPAVFAAAYCDSGEFCRAFLQRGVSLRDPCATKALQRVCSSGNIEIIKALLDSGCPVNLPEHIGDLCCWNEDLLKLRLQPLQILAYNGYSEAMRLLLSHGANANGSGWKEESVAGDDGLRHYSVLSSAALGGNLDCVRISLEAGADVNQPARGKFGRTALQSAAQEGFMDIVDELIRAGADVNAPPADFGGATALQAAAMGGFVGIATKLVDAGADVDAEDALEEGVTALEGAAEFGRISMVQFLLDAGADVQSPWFGDDQYELAVLAAECSGFNAVARLLERHRRSLPPLF